MRKLKILVLTVLVCSSVLGQTHWNKTPYIGGDGVMEVGRYLDFHNTDQQDPIYDDYSVRLYWDGNYLCSTKGMRIKSNLYLGSGQTEGNIILRSGNYQREVTLSASNSYDGNSETTYGLRILPNNILDLKGHYITDKAKTFTILSGSRSDGTSYNEMLQHRVYSGTSKHDLNFVNNGNIGIGTNSPNSKLHIKSNGEVLNILKLENETWKCNQEMAIEFWNGTGFKNVATSRIVTKMNNCSNGGENLLFQTQSPISAGVNQTSPTTKLFIKADGEIGIGTTSPSAKLHVAGNIKAQEIEVTLASIDNMQLNGTLAANNITVTANGQTADFVFSPTYQLKPLSEVETFIKANKHLPEIPSAAQMEEQGLNLAEMNKLLLQKVEELTLYSIEMEKARNKEQGEREKMEDELKVQGEKLNELDALIKEMITINTSK